MFERLFHSISKPLSDDLSSVDVDVNRPLVGRCVPPRYHFDFVAFVFIGLHDSHAAFGLDTDHGDLLSFGEEILA